jgi:GTP-binding protein Era
VAADHDYAAVVPISAAKGKQTDELLAEARKHLPNEPPSLTR